MNTELFIAQKVFAQKDKDKGIASRIISIAISSIAIGLAIMIISVSVLLGFKKQVIEKIIGFGSYFQIVNYDSNYSFETTPIDVDSFMVSMFLSAEHVRSLSFFATKPGIIKTKDAIHPMVLKGVCDSYNWAFFNENLVDGKIPQINLDSLETQEVLVSENQSKLLGLHVDDALYCYFYNEGETAPRGRKLKISGIYNTGMSEFDDSFVIGDIRQIQQLSKWTKNQISGYEIMIDDFENLETVESELIEMSINHLSEDTMLKVISVVKKYPMLFDWLSILDMNVWVLLVLILLVAGINMISGLLVIIIERSRMIGILKALGYPNISIRKFFLYLVALLSTKGLIWGNAIGLGVCVIQYFTGIIKLDASTYYLSQVPVEFNVVYILLLNVGTLIGIILMVSLPSMYISKISPAESMRIE